MKVKVGVFFVLFILQMGDMCNLKVGVGVNFEGRNGGFGVGFWWCVF